MEKKPVLSKQEILALRARAHHLNPVVMVGQHGLTEAVIRETETALRAHELIKVRVLGDERDERLLLAKLCARQQGRSWCSISANCWYCTANARMTNNP